MGELALMRRREVATTAEHRSGTTALEARRLRGSPSREGAGMVGGGDGSTALNISRQEQAGEIRRQTSSETDPR